MSDVVGLEIKVSLDDKMAKTSLEELKKGFDIPIQFNTEEITKITSQMKTIRELEVKSVVNDHAINSLTEMTSKLKEAVDLLEQLSQTEGSRGGGNSSHLNETLKIYKEINSLEKQKLSVTTSEQEIINQRISSLTKQADLSEKMITSEKELSKLSKEKSNLKEELAYQQDMYNMKQKNIAQTEISRKIAKEVKGEKVDSYNALKKLENERFNLKKRIIELEAQPNTRDSRELQESEMRVKNIEKETRLIRENIQT